MDGSMNLKDFLVEVVGQMQDEDIDTLEMTVDIPSDMRLTFAIRLLQVEGNPQAEETH